jgi:hypothetical protein
MMPAWDWSEDHDGSGSRWFKLPIREARERVSWTRRWRDCSRVFIWSWFRDAILLSIGKFGLSRLMLLRYAVWMMTGRGADSDRPIAGKLPVYSQPHSYKHIGLDLHLRLRV